MGGIEANFASGIGQGAVDGAMVAISAAVQHIALESISRGWGGGNQDNIDIIQLTVIDSLPELKAVPTGV